MITIRQDIRPEDCRRAVFLHLRPRPVFGVAGTLLVVSGLWQWHARSLPCPADKAQAAACARARQISWVVWGLSVALFVVGFFFAFLAASIFY